MIASWAGPSRPSASTARELGRKHADHTATIVIDDPTDAELDLLEVDRLPTWIGLDCPQGTRDQPGRDDLSRIRESAAWRHRNLVVGAHPKHVIESRFFLGS